MALLGPEGFRELGELIIQRAHFCASMLDEFNGVLVAPKAGFFKEFVVNFDGTGKSVREINESLLDQDILGGLDLSQSFPELGQSSLYCVTEIHSESDLNRLVDAVRGAC